MTVSPQSFREDVFKMKDWKDAIRDEVHRDSACVIVANAI
jgi:hypothetical protein